jgi:predicted TPR repeat methyltransferase
MKTMSRKSAKGRQSTSSMTPSEMAARLDFALQEHQRGKVEKARKLYQKILKASPQHADALHMLGLLEHQSGNQAAAIELFNKAVKAGSASAELYTNLGSALQAEGRLDEAVNSYRQAIALNPGFTLAYNNLGNALRAAGDRDAAASAFRRAIQLAPDFVLAHFNLGDLLHAQECYDEAIASMKRALALEPEFTVAIDSLALLYMKKGDNEEAKNTFRRMLELDKDNASARHLLAALEGQASTEAPSDYVVKLFDGYADEFEHDLVGKLEYQTPQKLYDLLEDYIRDRQSDMDVIDLGCGTGLCGPLFRKHARFLKGVDLSPGMLEKARERNIYDELLEGDLIVGLGTARDVYDLVYDLVIAADVFVYVGKLAQVFETTARALRPGGLFAFSLEAEEGCEDFVLRPTGRYAHSAGYAGRLAQAAGLRKCVWRKPCCARTRIRNPSKAISWCWVSPNK